MDPKEEVKKLIGQIETLKGELWEREKSLPAHSIRPHQLLAIEDLEEKIHALEERVKQLEDQTEKNRSH